MTAMGGESERRSWPAVFAVAFAAGTALAGGACGSGGSDEKTGGGPTTVAALDRDRARATGIVLSPAEVPNLAPAGPPSHNRLYAQCGVNPLLPGGDDPRQAPAPGFFKDETAEVKRAQTTAVASYAVLAPDEQVAKVVLATLRAPEFRACMERELRAVINGAAGRQLVSGGSTADIAKPTVGNEVVAFRTTILSGEAVHQTFDLTTVRKGRAVASVTTSRLGTSSFPDDERIRLTRLVAGRIG